MRMETNDPRETKRMGRPRIDPTLKHLRLNISLSPAATAKLRALGQGSLSKGIEIAAKAKRVRRKPTSDSVPPFPPDTDLPPSVQPAPPESSAGPVQT